MKVRKYEERLSEDAENLSHYLYQYSNCIGRKRSLEYRRKEILREFDNPLSGVRYTGVPGKEKEGAGCAALSFRLDEINTRIEGQTDKAVKALADIMDIIELLPENSLERAMIEHRYIDRFGWEKICRVENISRTPATHYWRKGLYMLLEFRKVQQILREYRGHSREG